MDAALQDDGLAPAFLLGRDLRALSNDERSAQDPGRARSASPHVRACHRRPCLSPLPPRDARNLQPHGLSPDFAGGREDLSKSSEASARRGVQVRLFPKCFLLFCYPSRPFAFDWRSRSRGDLHTGPLSDGRYLVSQIHVGVHINRASRDRGEIG